MKLEDGTYRILADASRADISADAPGHKFRASGTGLEGTATIADGKLTEASASFPLWQLDAGDPLSNREMRKFLEFDRRPTARGSIQAPIPIDGAKGTGTIGVEIPGRKTQAIPIRFDGDPSSITVHLDASFTRFGFKPPKLLFIKVKDAFQLTLTCKIERIEG